MKSCVFGAGAIGGYMAGELALAGHAVCAIARGAHLAALERGRPLEIDAIDTVLALVQERGRQAGLYQ
jgi:ketopantoate reductase